MPILVRWDKTIPNVIRWDFKDEVGWEDIQAGHQETQRLFADLIPPIFIVWDLRPIGKIPTNTISYYPEIAKLMRDYPHPITYRAVIVSEQTPRLVRQLLGILSRWVGGFDVVETEAEAYSALEQARASFLSQ
ncbi:MAG: hypothetical protein GYB68_01720 [Chloroflexi bacterium]|nr:hypothetical protein [Chloroflexota bacterium]